MKIKKRDDGFFELILETKELIASTTKGVKALLSKDDLISAYTEAFDYENSQAKNLKRLLEETKNEY